MITLATVMRANAVSCILFGLLFVVAASDVAAFLGAVAPAPKWLVFALGVGLILNGFDLIRVSVNPIPSKSQILYFSIADFIWATVSLGLILANLWITRQAGVVAALAVAVMVTIFGALQMIKRKEMGRC